MAPLTSATTNDFDTRSAKRSIELKPVPSASPTTAAAASAVSPPLKMPMRPEEPLLVLAQQAVAPIDNSPHRPVPRRFLAASRSKQRQGVVQARREAFDPEGSNLRRGEFDRQRQAVEPPANLDDRLS